MSISIPAVGSVKVDCRHYRGDRPCIHNRLCDGCGHYQPFGQRICIIKLGALGDVVRTLCLLPALKRAHPGSHITWVSQPAGCRMIGAHRDIDRALVFESVNLMQLTQEQFDLVISLDKEPQPCALAMSLSASRKLGVGLSAFGTPMPLNREAIDYFNLGLSDELKFQVNTKSYPQLVHEALGLTYGREPYHLPVDPAARQRVGARLTAMGWDAQSPTLGINVGAGQAFANKMWPAEKTAQLVRALRQQRQAPQVLLLGGPGERDTIDAIMADLAATSELTGVIDTGTQHEEPDFVALIDCCEVLFSGDTMAMHVAIARGKQVVVFFGPTCEQEIELYGRGQKLVARVPCGPCYKRRCDRGNVCLEAVSVQAADEAIAAAFSRVRGAPHVLPQMPRRKAG
jgi:ADP-heptose:LPS heptosyltransferase